MQNNLAEIAAALRPAQEALARAAGGELAEDIAASMRERGEDLIGEMFASTTAPSGAPWAPPARNYGHPLLHASGDLESSGVVTIGPRFDAKAIEITFSFGDEKAPWHHFGTKRGGRALSGTRRKSGADGSGETQHIPARPLLPAEGEEDRWREELEVAGQAACDSWITANVRF